MDVRSGRKARRRPHVEFASAPIGCQSEDPLYRYAFEHTNFTFKISLDCVAGPVR